MSPGREAGRHEAVWAVVTPVFEDGDSFAALCRDLARIDAGVALEILAVDDGTIVAPPAADAIRAAGLAGRIVRLKRNCGHQTAVWVGLTLAAAEPRYAGAVVMDSDGEDRPEDIARLIAAVGPDCDAAAARRGRRRESLSFRLFYRIYRTFFGLMTGRVIRFGNFCALGRRAMLRLAAMQETRIHLAAALIKSRLRRAEIPCDRGARYQGRSRMNFTDLALHGLRAVAVFDDAVLTRMGAICAGAAASGVAIFLIGLALKLSGQTTPGWLTFVTGFLVLVFLQTAILSLVALIMNALGYRSPADLEAAAASLILETETAPDEMAADEIAPNEVAGAGGSAGGDSAPRNRSDA